MYKDNTEEFKYTFNEIMSVLDRLNNSPAETGYSHNMFKSVLILNV